MPDTPPQSFSRSSVPNGLVVVENGINICVITSQKFAKGTRFGPLLAEKSYTPINGVKFPLIIFPPPLFRDEIAEFEALFNARNIYLDTTNESKCNWMIHVNTAQWSNEQNLICYQENDSIYYAAIHDIELGDILKVWYSPVYASRMGAKLLDTSPYDICNNILRQVSIDYGIKIDDSNVLETPNSYSYEEERNSVISSNKDREISLPPVGSLMKIVSPPNYNNYTSMHFFDLTPTDDTFELVNHQDPADLSSTSQIEVSEIEQLLTTNETTLSPDVVKFVCKVCCRKYATKLTLEKHLRTHDLYLCITCDKIYDTRNDMEEHECFKKRNKTRPLHCNICLKLLSNSWSLTRHMKIHRNLPNDKLLNINVSTNMPLDEQIKADEYCNESDDAMSTQILLTNAQPKRGDQDQNEEIKQLVQSKSAKIPSKRLEEPMECIVCRRPFKNPNALEKHLRFTHTVYTKNVTHTTYKKYAQEVRMKPNLTNNSSPVKPSIAKALASKLTNKKNGIIGEVGIKSNEHDPTLPLKETTNSMANFSNDSCHSESSQIDLSQQSMVNNGNEIIIFEVTELTENNMYDTNKLLRNTGTARNESKVVNGTDPLPKLMPIVDNVDHGLTKFNNSELRPTVNCDIVCNGITETNMIIPQPVIPEFLVKEQKMVDLKISKQETTAFRENNEEILSFDYKVRISFQNITV